MVLSFSDLQSVIGFCEINIYTLPKNERRNKNKVYETKEYQ
jgi:hypothetical protein